MKRKIKICHIVPSIYGGGVESAAKSFTKYSSKDFLFTVYYMKKNKNENNFINFFKTIKYLSYQKPDIILTSLWKSNFLSLIYKFLNKNVKLILFLHNNSNVHILDELITNITALCSFEIWADSEITMFERINELRFFKIYQNLFCKNIKKRVICFIKERIIPLPEKSCKTTFIFWGRLCQQKNLDKAIKFFSEIHKIYPDSTFLIIGSDNGVGELLHSIIRKMDLTKHVFIFNFMKFSEIRKYAKKASFFIQLSSYEGMAMSVSESMQLGLIPIVTNVGQIKIYCKNLFNSLIYNNNEKEVIKNISKLINSKKEYKRMRENSINTWSNSSTYKRDLIKNFEEISNYFV